MAHVILSLSGGLDSGVLCAALAAEHGPAEVEAVFFKYGSTHGPWEEQAARAVAAHAGVSLTVVDLRAVFVHARSALLESDGRPIPKAEYDEASMGQTIVPGRNLMFAAVLASMAESRSIPFLALATHAGDHHLYPDCRPAFNQALDGVVRESSGGGVRVMTPFSTMTKADIVAQGEALGFPFALTRSCYERTQLSCGLCGTCRERLEAFAANGLTDPLPYAGQGL